MSPQEPVERPTVLHVEDDSNDILLFQHACQKANVSLDLQAVADGQDAIAYLSGEDKYADRQKHPLPRLMLLDLKMPRVNGLEVLAWVRQMAPFRRLPVVVFSSSDQEQDVQRAYDAGANSYLVKPVNFHALIALARSIHGYWLSLNAAPE